MTLAEGHWNATRAVLASRRGEPPLVRLTASERAPASFAQEGLWLLDRMRPGDGAYNVAVGFRLRGGLHVGALERALTDVVGRHEILRTTVELDEGVLFQRVEPVPGRILRTENVPVDDVATWASARAHQPFVLHRGPLFRSDLARISDDDHCLLLSSHHAVLDAWSFEILMRELCDRYEMHVKGQVSDTVPAWQYRDFAAWQRQRMTADRCAGLEAYWCSALPAEAPTLALPTDRVRKCGLGGRGASLSRIYDKSLATALRSLAEVEKTTLFTVLYAAFSVLLHRYSGDTDIVVGSPFAIRNRLELAEMLGMLVNTLPLRMRFGESRSFRELLRQATRTVTGAVAHQELPFELLVRALGHHRYAGSPLFQAMFAFQNVPRSHWRFAGFACEAWNLEPASAKLDLTLTMQEREHGLDALFAYDADLFDAETVVRMMDHFENLLGAIVTDPDHDVGELPLLSPVERDQMLMEGQGATVPCAKSIHRLFEEQACLVPEATALVSDHGGRISYRELNQSANRLARLLSSVGVGRGSLVGICVSRSPSLVVAELAILKVGAAYVPIAEMQAARMKRVLRSLVAVVTDTASRSLLPAFTGTIVEVYDDSLDELSGDNLQVDCAPDDLAYVMFTSGSTGEPRGVSIPHRGVVRLVAGASYARSGPDDVFLQLAPSAFDASTFEIWGALLGGASLALAPPGPLSISEIAAVISRQRVTTLWLTAGLFELVVEADPPGLDSLRRLLTGGDVASVWHARRFRQRWPSCRLFNCYGPTENTTFSTVFEVTNVDDERCLPIGRPVANTRLYLLDSHMEPVPKGVTGEAYLGGDGVARGYLEDAAATRERFISSPFVPGDVLYRTGDRMRRRRDGELEFVGRCDDQLKISGYRIEPCEVEQALRACPGVRDALVRAEGEGAGGKKLCAYVVADDDAQLSGKLRAALRARLPDYMVPPTITRVPALTTTENGKRTVPAGVLPSLQAEHPVRGTEAEANVARAFAKALAVGSVGLHESFFDLGGDSVSAIRVICILEAETKHELALSLLYENPSAAALARAMSELSVPTSPTDPGVMMLKAGRSQRPLFLIAGGRGGKPELTICAKLVSRLPAEETVYGLLAPSGAPPVEEAARRHLARIRRLQSTGPYRLGGECIGGVVAYEVAQQLVASGENVELLLLLDTFCPTGTAELPDFKPRPATRGEVGSRSEPGEGRSFLARRFWLRPGAGTGDGQRRSLRKMLDKSFDLLRSAAAFLAELPTRSPTADSWPAELWRRLTVSAEVKRHIETCMGYRPAPYPGRIIVFASAESLRQGLASPWQALALGGTVVRQAPGDHDSYSRRYYRETAEALRRCLEEEERGAHGH